MSTSGYFSWAPNDQTFSEFVSSHTLPAVILVTSGHCGDTAWESLSAQEVIRIHCRGSRMRVIARDSRGRGYSIPVNYPVPFKVANHKGSRPLHKIVEKGHFPVEIQVAPEAKVSFKANSESKRTIDLGPLVIKSANDIYEETFVKGNGLSTGSLNPEIIVFPSYIGIRVCVAEQNRINRQLTAQAATLDYSKVMPAMDITQYSEAKLSAGQSVYASLEPDQYVTYTSLMESSKDSHHIYDGLHTKPTPGATSKATATPSKPTPPPTTSKPKVPSAETKPKLRRASDSGVTPRTGPLPKVPSQPTAKVAEDVTDVYSEIPSKQVPIDYNFKVDYSKPPDCKNIKSFDDVPADLEQLSIEDVSDCLRLLRMPMYVGRFLDNLIDGKLLFHLDKAMMEGELGMTSLHSAKLQRFVHNRWRPNFGT